ncbi:MAG: hypothetical protein SFW67_28005 [Myxococcaceae bacterium]|nr:hypothetical protein [Myxococcaceae bacterium]
MRLLWTTLLSVTLAACNGTPAPVAVASLRVESRFRASCATPALGVCTEYRDDAFALGESRLKAGCDDARGVWGPARCSPTHRLGTCATAGRTRVYYPGGALSFSSTTAARDCVELYQGVFHALPPSPHQEPP